MIGQEGGGSVGHAVGHHQRHQVPGGAHGVQAGSGPGEVLVPGVSADPEELARRHLQRRQAAVRCRPDTTRLEEGKG